MQNIREWREGSITRATVVYEIPIDGSRCQFGIHTVVIYIPIRNTKDQPFTNNQKVHFDQSCMENKQTTIFMVHFGTFFPSGKCAYCNNMTL